MRQLRDVVELVSNGADFRNYVEDGTPFIRVADIRPDGVDYSNAMRVPQTVSDVPDGKRVRAGDVLFTRKASFGVAAVATAKDESSIISSEIIRIVPVQGLNPHYLAIFNNSTLGQAQCQRHAVGAVMPGINHPTLLRFEIPLPHRAIQDAIADLMNAAYRRKREMEAEAKALLDSIDAYLLAELGIDLGPGPKARPWFGAWASSLRGSRLDAGAASNTFDPRDFPAVKWTRLHEIATLPRETIDTRRMPDEQFLFVAMTDVDDELGQVAIRRVSGREIAQTKRVLRGGDTVFARIEPCIYNRKTALIPKDVELAVGSTELLVARPRKDVRPGFLTLCLRSELIQRQIMGLMTGTTGRRRLPHSDFAQLLVPVCAVEKQSLIVIEAQRRRAHAAALRSQAEQLLVQARAEVERMILGREEV